MYWGEILKYGRGGSEVPIYKTNWGPALAYSTYDRENDVRSADDDVQLKQTLYRVYKIPIEKHK